MSFYHISIENQNKKLLYLTWNKYIIEFFFHRSIEFKIKLNKISRIKIFNYKYNTLKKNFVERKTYYKCAEIFNAFIKNKCRVESELATSFC